MFVFEEIDKDIQINSLFLGIRETFISVFVRQVAFLSENWKRLFIWSSVLFNCFRKAWKESI